MDSKEFAAAYHADIPTQRLAQQPLPELMAESRCFSERFGHLLYDYLQHPGQTSTDDSLMTDYGGWLKGKFATINNTLSGMDDPAADRASSEFNFHRLNSAMISMWIPILNGKWPPALAEKGRADIIAHAQNMVALHGLRAYYQREQVSTIKVGHKYFSPENERKRAVFEGALNEFDAAIVLLETIKRDPGLTVLPAPLQFEHAHDRYNVDFVVASESGHAVGVQVKSFVQTDKKARYDQTRVVLLDAKVDFGNVLAKRTRAGSSQVRQVGWAGLICAQRASSIVNKGVAQSLFAVERLDPRTINRHIMLAKQMLRGIRPNLREVVERVGPRVLSQL